jgi:Tol biopolymer transport system component
MDLNYLVGSAALAAALIAHPGAAADNVVISATTVQADASAANRAPAAEIETEYVRPLMRIETGRNDSNPTWSPSGALLAIERSRGDKKEIVIAHPDGSVAEIIYYQLSGESKEKKFFFPGVLDDTSYNAGVTWSPTGDRLAFMSNGGEGNYDLYLRERNGRTLRLTDHKEKDGQANWSPVSDRLVFVSGRSGKGDIYLLDLATRAVTRLTQGGKPYLYPQWSPDGRKVTMIHGSNENHDIYVIGDVSRPVETLMALTTWPYDDLRPVWSPDGKKIAFYSNYNQDNDLKRWCIIARTRCRPTPWRRGWWRQTSCRTWSADRRGCRTARASSMSGMKAGNTIRFTSLTAYATPTCCSKPIPASTMMSPPRVMGLLPSVRRWSSGTRFLSPNSRTRTKPCHGNLRVNICE